MKTKQKSSEEKFRYPTHFDLELKNKNKDVLMPVMTWLIDKGTSSLKWKWKLLETTEEFTLTIQGCWAENLCDIAKLLGDYEDNGD